MRPTLPKFVGGLPSACLTPAPALMVDITSLCLICSGLFVGLRCKFSFTSGTVGAGITGAGAGESVSSELSLAAEGGRKQEALATGDVRAEEKR